MIRKFDLGTKCLRIIGGDLPDPYHGLPRIQIDILDTVHDTVHDTGFWIRRDTL